MMLEPSAHTLTIRKNIFVTTKARRETKFSTLLRSNSITDENMATNAIIQGYNNNNRDSNSYYTSEQPLDKQYRLSRIEENHFNFKAWWSRNWPFLRSRFHDKNCFQLRRGNQRKSYERRKYEICWCQYIFSRPTPIAYSRETISPSSNDDVCRWRKKTVVYSTPVAKIMDTYVCRHRSRSQCHTTQNKTTVNNCIIIITERKLIQDRHLRRETTHFTFRFVAVLSSAFLRHADIKTYILGPVFPVHIDIFVNMASQMFTVNVTKVSLHTFLPANEAYRKLL